MNKITSAAVGAALLLSGATAFAETTSSTTPVVGTPASNISCVVAAVDAREQAIGAAFTTFSSAESSALSTRATALHAAWGLGDAKARKAGREAAWDAFKKANRAAYAALRSARKTTWDTFAKATRACKSYVVESSSLEGAGSLGL